MYNMDKELVSIIMPVHNEERFLASAIESAQSQTYENWELLAIDDCSTDSSADIIKAYAAKDPRVRYMQNTDQTYKMPAKPRNVGIENAKGRYIAFLDSDDLWLPTKLEHQLQVFEHEKDAVIVYANYKRMSLDGKIHRRVVKGPESTDYKKMLKSNVMGCLTVMYDSAKVGRQYCPVCGYDDFALWLQILRNGGKAYNTNTVEALYRLKGKSVSSNVLTDIGWQWNILRNNERIALLPSVYYLVNYVIRAIIKRL